MGCFDSLIVKCRECGSDIEFQSKAGDCGMTEYTLSNCPPEIAGALNGDSKECRSCGKVTRLRAHVFLTVDG